MPFCPKCRAEYVEGVETCPDCHIPLIHELPPKKETKRAKLAKCLQRLVGSREKAIEDNGGCAELAELEQVSDEVSGVMIKGILENNGIYAVLREARIPWYNIAAFPQSGYYQGRILVPERDLERARKILDEYLKSLEKD